jgi:glycosyltransferase involved in cell wall biosynthesis
MIELARRDGVAHAVTVAGWDPDALADHFARAALAIYPFEDTLVNRAKCPAKLLEMLAAGVPVIAEGVGEVREFIRHAETGWLVPPGDTDSFAAAVARLLVDSETRAHMGRAAVRDANKRLSWVRSVDNVERAYRAAGAGR